MWIWKPVTAALNSWAYQNIFHIKRGMGILNLSQSRWGTKFLSEKAMFTRKAALDSTDALNEKLSSGTDGMMTSQSWSKKEKDDQRG